MKYVEIDFDRVVELFRQKKSDKVFILYSDGSLVRADDTTRKLVFFILKNKYFEQI